MDILNIKSVFIKKILNKVISTAIYKKTGMATKLNIEELSISHNEGGKVEFTIKLNGEIPENELVKLLRTNQF